MMEVSLIVLLVFVVLMSFLLSPTGLSSLLPSTPGVPGERGERGEKGDTGPKGDTVFGGAKGDTGPMGIPGAIGLQGAKGDTGPIGLQGAKGDTGDTGPIGIQGEKGDTGDTGPLGIQGEKGDTGNTGPIGLQGEKGDTGDTGPLGIQGEKGDTGDTGPIGIQGEKGDTGDTGAIGIQGEKGDTGDTGPIGIQGEKGDTGDTGPIGLQGEKGDTGDTGPIGLQGEKGDTGDTGPIGLQGEKGDTGDTGPIGLQGEKGDTGDTGPIGLQGVQGDTGDTGPQGPKGDTGDTGPSGGKGETGALGPSGADWSLSSARYYAVDNDDGLDTNTGYSDVSLAEAGTWPLKTLEELNLRVPRIGNARKVVIAIKARDDCGTYVEKDLVTPARLRIDAYYGYNHMLIRATGDVPSAGAVAFSNSVEDKIALGSRIVPGTSLTGYNPTGSPSASVFDVAGSPAFPAEPALIGKRVRFDRTTVTTLLQNAVAMIHANDTDTITVSDNFTATPTTGDTFYIEEPCTAVDSISVTSTIPNTQAYPSALNQGIHMAGFRTTDAASFASGGLITGPILFQGSFIDVGSTGATAINLANFFDCRYTRSYVDETVTTRTTGVGVRAIGLLNANRGTFLNVTSSALVGATPNIGRVQATTTSGINVGSGSYFRRGVLLQGGGTGVAGGNANVASLIGKGTSSTTVRHLRVVNALSNSGIFVGLADCQIWGVDFSGFTDPAAFNLITLRGINNGWSIADCIGTATGVTGTNCAVDLSTARDCSVTLGVLSPNTFTVTGLTTAKEIQGAGPVFYVHADYARTDLKDNLGNHLQGSAGTLIGTTTLATNDGSASIGQYKVVRPSASSGTIVAAQANSVTNAVAVGVTQSATTATSPETTTMLVNGGGTWIQFDATPTVGSIAYLSTTTAGNATVTAPTFLTTERRLRLGRVLRVSGTLGFVAFFPDTVSFLADGTDGGDGGSGVAPNPVDFFDDFIVGMPVAAAIPDESMLGQWIVNRSGSGSNVFIETSGNMETGHPGVLALRVQNAGTASGINMGGPNGTIDLDPNMTFTFEILLRIPILSPTTSSDAYTLQVGLHDSYGTSTATNGVYFEHTFEATPTWKAICRSGGVSTTLTGPTVSANEWIKLFCTIVGTTSAVFSIRPTTAGSETTIGTITTNIPGTAQLSPNLRMIKTTLTTIYTVYFDYWYHRYTFATKR